MKIALLEPIGVSKEVIDELSAPITEKGHEFVYYDTKTTDPAELAKRSEGCDIVMIANNPYPTEVVEKADALKMLSVAFTGIDHIGTDKCKEKNIMICNAAGYSNQTVAELIIGMAIDALRHVVKAAGIGGSISNTSTHAYTSLPSFSAFASASLSTIGPLAQLMKIVFSFISAILSADRNPLVSAFSGRFSDTISLVDNTSSNDLYSIPSAFASSDSLLL